MSMGSILFAFTAALEIALVVLTCRKATDKKTWRKNRLIVRMAEVAVAIVAILLPFGQKWRIIPALVFLAILVFLAALTILVKRKKTESKVKKGRAIISGVLSIVFIGLTLVPTFLFSSYEGLPAHGKYPVKGTSAILIDSSRTDPFEQDGSFREVPVHLYYPETDTEFSERFPLVIFSHGAFGYYQSNTSTYMELASNGYVVAALDHPYHAFFTEDTDGKSIIVDMSFFNTVMSINIEEEAQVLCELYSEWMALRTADMNCAIDKIKAAAISGTTDESWYIPEGNEAAIRTALRMTDVAKIGLMGHSMGGAAAVELGRERDDVSAVIDLDGTMLGEYTGVENGELTIREDPYAVPVLEFNNWDSYNDRKEYIAQGGRYPNDELIGRAAAGFSATIRGTKHMDFTDLPMFSPFLGKMLGSGERDTAETMTDVNSLVLQFFNRYLKGEGVFTVQDIY